MGEHEMPGSWSVYEWSAGEGFGAQAEQRSGNGKRERIWFSPACQASRQASLFEEPSTTLQAARADQLPLLGGGSATPPAKLPPR